MGGDVFAGATRGVGVDDFGVGENESGVNEDGGGEIAGTVGGVAPAAVVVLGAHQPEDSGVDEISVVGAVGYGWRWRWRGRKN